MANEPQNGYTQVPDDFMASVQRVNLSAYESRVLWCVVQKTLRFHKATDRISFSQFQESTDIARAHIGRALDHLVKRHIVICIGTGYKLEYGIQTDYTEWLESLPKQVTNESPRKSNYQLRLLPKEVTNNPAQSLPNGVTKSLPEQVTNANEKSLPEQDESLPIQERSLPGQVTNSLPEQVNTLEYRDLTLKNTLKKKGLSPPVLAAETPAAEYLFEKTSRKRWANKVQKEQFEACEKEVGTEIMKAAVDWALTSGIANIKSMITTARKKKREGGHGTRPSEPRRTAAPHQRDTTKGHSTQEYGDSQRRWSGSDI